MNTFINFGMPHVAELIFKYVDVGTLLQIRLVSKTWKEIAKSVVLKLFWWPAELASSMLLNKSKNPLIGKPLIWT